LSPAIKSLNYLNNVLARIEANDKGADEALFLDHNGYVAEATVDNFFIVVDRTLLTPPTATNLKGITRETVLELAADLGIRTEEGFFHLFRGRAGGEGFKGGQMGENGAGGVGGGPGDGPRRHARTDDRPPRRCLRADGSVVGHADQQTGDRHARGGAR